MYKVSSFYFPNTHDSKKDYPREDVSFYDDTFFIVADGVGLKFIEPYPNPSTSYLVAQTVVDAISVHCKRENLNSLYESFDYASQKVKGIPNIKSHYAGATLAYGFINNDVLYFAQLNDAGVMVFDKFGNREVDFVQNHTDLIHGMKALIDSGKYVADSKEEYVYTRENIVNKQFDFGVLNGDDFANDFLHVGATDMKAGQFALFYTDGFLPYVYDNEFIKTIMTEDIETSINTFVATKSQEADKYKKEKSLVVVKRL